MEYTVHQYRFRLEFRGRTIEVAGRSLENIEGLFNLQIRFRSPEHAAILLEVQFCDEEKLWSLFWKVCGHRGVLPISYKRQKANGGWTEWEMLPDRPTGFKATLQPLPEDPLHVSEEG